MANTMMNHIHALYRTVCQKDRMKLMENSPQSTPAAACEGEYW